MKKLSIEEKAKAYDEAINRIKHYIVDEYGCSRINVADVFPELKESEDEKIREGIIKSIFDLNTDWLELHGVTKENALAWLKKQGEQKESPCNRCRKEQPYHFCQDITALGRCYLEHEQKPDDKIEPKFKKGDWVVCQNEVCQIKHREEGYNLLINSFGINKEPINERLLSTAHLWTIEDAKDGDVLVASDGSIFIFKEVVDCGCKHYIALTKDTKTINVNDNLEHFWESVRGVKPSTKEQRDLLFSKMKEAGYEWDAEKKELKKIEQKPAEWSEEDETALGDALWCCKQAASIAKDENDMGNAWYAEKWLKSLKEKCTWKPSDEQMEALRIAYEVGTANESWAMGKLKPLYNDLKNFEK